MKIGKVLPGLVTMTLSYLFVIVFFGFQVTVFGTKQDIDKTTVKYYLNTTGCPLHEFLCDSICYDMNQYCDGIRDCEDISDEPEGCIPIPRELHCLHGHFTCKTTHRCIPLGWVCDGEVDCGTTRNGMDNSDEEDCNKNIPCPWNHAKCGPSSNQCIPLTSFCDGVRDCENDADELDFCETSVCDTAQCVHGCKPTFEGPMCYCLEGYRPGGDGTICIDADECELGNTCEQICINSIGSYQCRCVSGYKMENGSCIGLNVPIDEPTSILFSTLNTIQRITPDGRNWSIFSRLNLLNSHGLEFSHRNRSIYYIHHNMSESTFMAVNVDNFTERWPLPKPVVFDNLDSIQQIALDWLTGNWYFLDDEKEIILLCNNTLRWCKTVIDVNLDKGRALALNPMIGFMYFSKWGMSAPVIERCRMDGTGRETLVDRKIVYPYGVIVDYATNDVYWLDTYLDVIERVSFDGKNRRTVMKGSAVQNLYGISIFENTLYVTSWKDNSVYKINKKTLDTQTVKTNISRPFHIHVFHRQRQPDVAHPCRQNNGNCSHICVTNWNSSIAIAKCLCSMGYTLKRRTGECTLNSAPVSLITAKSRPLLIQSIDIENGTETIIPIAGIRITALEVNVQQKSIYYADGHSASIYSISLNGSNKIEVLSNGADKCVSIAYDWMGGNLYWADNIGSRGRIGVVKLADVTKKRFLISEYKTYPTDIVLNPKKGIMYWIGHDGTTDIGTIYSAWMDGTHKETFVITPTPDHSPSQLAIDLIGKRLYWCSVLNRIESIDFNKSDRKVIAEGLDTAFTLAFYKRNLFYTESNNLISLNVDTNEKTVLRQVNPFVIEMAIFNTKGQTGANHCTNTSDCQEICLLIPKSVKCECSDGFNFINSTCVKSTISCEPGQFQCKSTGDCIPEMFTCNHRPDCDDGSDESYQVDGPCGKVECTANHFRCDNDRRCVNERLICDGDLDCEDGSDEPTSCLRNCTENQFKCVISKRCIPNVWKCDSFIDCGVDDDSDEQNCETEKCELTDFTCNNGKCISMDLYCDEIEDCADGSDEKNCLPSTDCHAPKLRCNGFIDCPDGSDEENCHVINDVCGTHMFYCGTAECIPKIYVCDSLEDCSNGRDEKNCSNSDHTIKPPHHHDIDVVNCHHPSRWCDNNTVCVNVNLLCDGKYDCDDYSDEGLRCDDKVCLVSSVCSHNCHNAPEGAVCSCPDDLFLQPDKKHCLEMHPCESWGVCSQKCIPIGSRYKCECHPGYSLMADGFTCKSESNATAFVLFSNRFEVRSVDIHSFNGRSLISSLKNTIALDFYVGKDTQMIFWTDVLDDKIYRGTVSGNSLSSIEVVVQTGLATAEGLAVDWIGENLYWSESKLDQIEVAKLNGSFRRTLVGGEMDSPRAIALDPRRGYLFWTDWDNDAPRIERCSLAGLDRKIIVLTDSIDGGWPNGITLDYDSERIYWIDARSDSIHTATYDGSDKRLVLRNHDMLSHPFAISLFENYVYWTDWRTNSVARANKWTGSEVFVIQRTLTQPFDIEILHPSRQPRDGPNPCGNNNGGCSHLCLIHTNHTYRCDCPHVMRLNVDNKTCVVNERLLLISRQQEIRGVDLQQPYYHMMPTIRAPEVMQAQQIEYLAKNSTIYWVDMALNEIKRSGLTMDPIQLIIDTRIKNPMGLALDWLSNLLFVGSLQGITVYNLEGEYSSIIIKDTHVSSVAIDPTNGKLYWISINETNSSVERSLMDGSERKTLVMNSAANFMSYLSFDKDDNRLYWISNKKISYYDLRTGKVYTLNLPSQSSVITATTYKGLVYYADSNDQSIHTADKTTGENDTTIRNTTGTLSLRIYDPSEQKGRGPCDEKKNGCDHLCIPMSSNESRCICATGYTNDPSDPKRCLGVPEFIFYSKSWEIIGVKINESLNEMDTLGPISKVYMANSIDYLAAEDLIFWVDSDRGIIFSIKRDGTNRKVIIDQHEGVENVASDLITGIAVDWSARNIYWIDIRHSVIEVARIDGSSRYVVISQDLGNPSSIAVDPHKGVLVWGGRSKLTISKLDGSYPNTLINEALLITDVSLDSKREHIYFCDHGNRTIERIDYDGTNRIVVLNASNTVSVAFWNDMLYWLDTSTPGSLKVAPVQNLSNISVLLEIDHSETLKDVQVFSLSRQQTTNPCIHNNGGCQHLCLFNGTFPLCVCPHGKVAEDGTSCEDYDSVIMFSKVLSIDSIHIQDDNIQNAPYPSIKNSTFLKNAIALSFNYGAKRLFYSDIQRGSINSVFFNGTDHRILVERQGSVEGLTYEEVYNTLYWTCNNEAAISHANLTQFGTSAGNVEVVIKLRSDDKPRGIAVDSCGGRLYWTNWNSLQPAIESAYLSGYGRRIIISTEIRMPNGITLDHKAQKLYWSDARLDKIERCEYDGSNRIILAKVTPQHPFALAVYGDYIYWTDWLLHSVLRADKVTGLDVVWLRRDVDKPMGIVAIANDTNNCLRNPCSILNGGCAEVCILTPSGEVSCGCLEGYTLAEDGFRCFLNSTTSCTGDSFRCSDGGCVPFEQTCDTIKHCIDGSDEEPGYCAHRVCPQAWFMCMNRRCIQTSYHCNGIDECGDSSDEINCSCPETTKFKCLSGECIPRNFTCDRDPDCRDASDERNCGTLPCKGLYGDEFFSCNNTFACLHTEWICDGEDDCWDMSDEMNCAERNDPQCKKNEFYCLRSRKCIDYSKRCDNFDDCEDAEIGGFSSDEEQCSLECNSYQFRCNDSTCLPESVRCNGRKDCPDGSDEEQCSKTCRPTWFTCDSGDCIPKSWVCDGQNDCLDQSDEKHHCPTRTCSSTEFRCSSNKCIPKQMVCDGEPDCDDHGDELQCPEFCDTTEFQCADGTCISLALYCNGHADCGDKSDEPPFCASHCNLGQFQCSHGTCISAELVCDKKKDCIDGSDEEGCIDHHDDDCKDKYKCTNGVCVNESLLCNGEDDCGDYSDEHLCNINECRSDQNICTQNCTDKPIGFECSCYPGYKLNPDKPGKCVDINECEDRPCSQKCRNHHGSFTCSCKSNYYLESDNRTCVAVTTETPKIIVANRYYIRQVDLVGRHTILVHNLSNAVALDFDWKSNCYFWSDVVVTGSKIMKLCENATNKTTTILHGPSLQNPDGMAIDWIGRNLYWCDKGLDTIEVSTMDGKFRKILVSVGLEEPRAIALNPLKGFMYWSDWGDNVHIGKADMDGSNATILIEKNLGWPNALTIDYETDEIFWADAREDYIAVADLHGNNIRIVADRNSNAALKLHHVFAITIWEDRLYWTDWEMMSIESCHKYYGNETKTLFKMVHRPMDLRLYHPFRQPQHNNPCEKANCSALCLLTSEEPFYKCACPENHILGSDEKSCISNCTSAHFECATSYKCIPFWWKCDTQDDCDDKSDEPSDCPPFNCQPGQYQCNNNNTTNVTKCIHPSELCNGIDNCGNNDDEKNCYNYTCLNTQYKCKGNDTTPPKCVSILSLCNKIDDCPFGDDEKDCPPRSCPSNNFQCKNDQCVPQVWVCDGEVDCRDGSDETDCANRTCDVNQFSCTNGRCIPNSWKCDGDKDCPDGADEPESCRGSNYHTCEPSYHKCLNGKCIPGRWRCDYVNDCGDWSDEHNCTMRECSESEHRCGNGKCVPATAVCDGQFQCEDKSDEAMCDPKCGDNKFQCGDPKMCIYIDWRCDGEIDCADASDELNCNKTCPNNGFKCSNGFCINEQWVCDGQDDCENNSDESPELCINRPCLANYFRCSNHLCVPMHQVCDGVDNCRDASDELQSLCHSTRTCRSHEFKCNYGHCINNNLVCDGQNDCFDNSDEVNCAKNGQCKWNTCSQICVQESENKTMCKCADGFHHNSDTGCSAAGKPATLILAVEAELRLISPYKADEPNELYNKSVLMTIPRYKVGSIDIYSNKKELTVFCTNHQTKQVESIDLYLVSHEHIRTEGNLVTVLKNLIEPRGLAVDWVTKKLYITDTNRIVVSTFNGSHSFTLINGNMKQSRDIVVAPEDGLLFWADWGPVAVIETSHMDGNQRQVLLKHDILWPTGLAIDYPTKRLYWADPKTNYIGSVNFNGSKKEITHRFSSEVKPFKIDVFEDYIYLTTYRTHNVFRFHKHGKDNRTYLAMGLARLYDIQILHEHKQTKNLTNRCLDACHSSEICLLNPNGTTCVCPDGSLKTNFTCQVISEPCPLNCNSGTCVMNKGEEPKCDCPPKYSGRLCEHYRCSQFCHNKGMCYVDYLTTDPISLKPKLRCYCQPQFTGEHCETPLSICNETCYNGGTCYSTQPNVYQCSCPAGFSGQKCEHCSRLQCHNGGVCKVNQNGEEETCSCPVGFKGKCCDIFVCDNFCSKNGNCIATPDGPTCRCNPGYAGDRCEKDLCSQKCLNGGTCIMGSGIKQLECECSPFFAGRRCQINLCDGDNPPAGCPKTCPCLNEGKCIYTNNSFTCKCPPKWTGIRCEIYISANNNTDTRCDNLCVNDGICRSALNEVYCECRKPFEGVHCEHSTAKCEPSCLNNGTCDIDANGLNFCKCPIGFEGQSCETPKLIESTQANAGNGNYVLVTLLTVIILVVIASTIFGYLYIRKRKPFSHERLQENDFNNPIYQDRDAEPFTLDTDRSNNFVNPVYETVYNGTTGVKEEKAGLLQNLPEGTTPSPVEGL
nr:low-density lipoprotein receptor-related protein 1 isoform X1 [Onthophagus taurus]